MPAEPGTLEYAKYVQEWWKVGISALTPIAIAVLTYFISNSLNERQSYLRKGEQTLSEKQKIYAKLGECLNAIYVYAADIGDFRQYTPDQIIEKKRDADRTFHVYGPYWSAVTKGRYDRFMRSAFEMYTGSGQNAKIRSSPHEKERAFENDGRQWESSWNASFTDEYDDEIHDNYGVLVESFLEDIVTLKVK